MDWTINPQCNGLVRRRHQMGRPLHCCCVCGKLDVWDDAWSWFGSLRDEEKCRPLRKFCSDKCKKKAGPFAVNLTEEMIIAARQKEWREPDPIPPRPRSYAEALYEQQRENR